MVRRFVVVLVGLVVVVAGCSGEGVSPFATLEVEEATSGGGWLDVESLEVAEAISMGLGPEPGLLAVARALDRGYEADQIITAGRSGALGTDGMIAGVVPAVGGWGIFEDLPFGSAAGSAGLQVVLAAFGAAEASEENPYEPKMSADQAMAGLEYVMARMISPENLPTGSPPQGEVVEDPLGGLHWATILTGIIVDLADVGYTAEQILVGLVSGEVELTSVDVRASPEAEEGRLVGCWTLAGEDGSLIAPEGRVIGAFTNTGICHRVLSEATRPADDTDRPTPPDDQPGEPGAAEGAYRLEASMSVPGEGASLTVTWLGGFDVDGNGVVVGLGTGSATSEGACSIGEGEPRVYSFSVTWGFGISGSRDGEQIELLLRGEPETTEVSEGAGTESGEACVELARGIAAELGSGELGGDLYPIVVPVSGGTIRLGAEPFFYDISVTPQE